jgi:hypothetical protein
MFKDNTIHICEFCKSKCTGKFCNYCKTAEQRKKQVIEQLEIEKENEAKGFKIPKTLFGFTREKVMEKL